VDFLELAFPDLALVSSVMEKMPWGLDGVRAVESPSPVSNSRSTRFTEPKFFICLEACAAVYFKDLGELPPEGEFPCGELVGECITVVVFP